MIIGLVCSVGLVIDSANVLGVVVLLGALHVIAGDLKCGDNEPTGIESTLIVTMSWAIKVRSMFVRDRAKLFETYFV